MDLFLTTNPTLYTVKVSAALGSSDHLLVTVSFPLISGGQLECPPPSERRRLWHYGDANWKDLRLHFSVFPWNDHCFRGRGPSECVERITEVILDGMETYIPSSFPSSRSQKPWFNTDCSRAIRLRDGAYRKYRRLQTPESRSSYISCRNRAKTVIRLAKDSFLRDKCNIVSGSSSSRAFWHLAKNISSNFASSSFPPLHSSDGSVAVLPSAKAELLAEVFAVNSTLDDSGAVLPNPPAPRPFMSNIRITNNDVKTSYLSWIPTRRMVLMVSLLWFLSPVHMLLHHVLVSCFVFVWRPVHFLLPGKEL